jgi:F0F1-type ATP synthase membrane subunit b/b'
MAEQQNTTMFQNDEFTKIFDAYRAKIDEITQRTQRNFHNNGGAFDAASGDVSDDPEVKISQVLEELKKQPETTSGPIKIELSALKESEEIISEAKRKARQIVAEAEASIRKEAKKRTQSLVEKITENAQKDAEDILAQAKEAAEEERNKAIATVRKETAQLVKEITERCRQETQAQSSQIVAETQEKAAKMITDTLKSSAEISRFIEEMVIKNKNMMNEFQSKLQIETAGLAKSITETQNKLQHSTVIAKEEEAKPEPPNKNKEQYKNPTLAVHLLSDKSVSKNGNNGLFIGQIEMKSVSTSFDYQYLKNLKKYLINIPSIKYLQESASEKETTVLFDVKEPLPLLDILNNIPLVDEIITETDDDIFIIFKDFK